MTIRKYKSANKGGDRKVELLTHANDINILIQDNDTGQWPTLGITLSAADAHDIAQAILAEVEKPAPPKFVPEDGIYVNKGFSLHSKIYKYRNGAWRNPEGYVIEGRQDELSTRAQSGDLVRLVKEGY